MRPIGIVCSIKYDSNARYRAIRRHWNKQCIDKLNRWEIQSQLLTRSEKIPIKVVPTEWSDDKVLESWHRRELWALLKDQMTDFCHRDQADWKNPRIVPGVLESGHRFVLWAPLDDQGEDQITQRALPPKSETFPSGILMKARETRILNGCDENYLLNWEKYKTEIMAYLRWSKIVEKMCRNPRSDRRPG